MGAWSIRAIIVGAVINCMIDTPWDRGEKD
jgi:hypothetical protein